MGKLIKAEFYRNKRINGFWIFTICMMLMMIAVPFTTGDKVDSADAFFRQSMSGITVFMMMASLMASYITGRGYYHRTSMYEVMAGNSPVRIIFSKIVSIAFPTALIVFLSHMIGVAIAAAMNSDGLGDIMAREPLFFLSIFRATIFGVLLTMIVKSMVGTALVYVRSIVETIGLMIASAVTGKELMFDEGTDLVVGGDSSAIINTICLSQQGTVLMQPMGGTMITEVVLGFLGEVLLWGVISYIIYSKKDY